MIKMQGSSRILDSAVTETGTSAARKISLYGVTSLSELADKPLLVKSANNGVANTTIQINNLAAKSLKVMKNNVTVDTYANWITAGQLYFLMYNGNVFTAFPVGISSAESSGAVVFNIPVAAAALTSTNVYADILAAFGSADTIIGMQTAIEYGETILTFEDELTPNRRLYLLFTKYDAMADKDILAFIVDDTGTNDYYLIRQEFTRNSVEGATELYTSVSVTRTLISANPDITEYAPRVSTITIETTDWVLNSTTNNYEYTVTNSTITANHLVEIYMDLANQALMTDGYTESFNGGYKIITTAQPSASITMTVKVQKTIAI